MQRAPELWHQAAILLIAIYGAIANTLMTNQIQKRYGWDLFWLMFSNMLISGFCGLMSLYLSNTLRLDIYEQLMMAGIAGYMGGKFLELMEAYVRKRFPQ